MKLIKEQLFFWQIPSGLQQDCERHECKVLLRQMHYKSNFWGYPVSYRPQVTVDRPFKSTERPETTKRWTAESYTHFRDGTLAPSRRTHLGALLTPRTVMTPKDWTTRNAPCPPISSNLSDASNVRVRLWVATALLSSSSGPSVSPSSTIAVPYAWPSLPRVTRRAYGAVALARVVYPGCECRSNAAPERMRTGMWPRGASRCIVLPPEGSPFTMVWVYQSRQMTCPRPGRKPVQQRNKFDARARTARPGPHLKRR